MQRNGAKKRNMTLIIIPRFVSSKERNGTNNNKKKKWIRIVVITVMVKVSTYCLLGIIVSATSIIRFDAPKCSEIMPLMYKETEA